MGGVRAFERCRAPRTTPPQLTQRRCSQRALRLDRGKAPRGTASGQAPTNTTLRRIDVRRCTEIFPCAKASAFLAARGPAGLPRQRQRSQTRAAAGPSQGGCWGSVRRPYTAALIIPTGVGAAVGGCAGDALPVARAFSEAADCLITHPNVLNGAMLYWPLENTLYVEGYGLDKFAAGDWGLLPVHQNKVGLVLDGGMEEELLQRHLQAADAARATLGISMPAYAVTDQPLQIEKWLDPATGASTGRIGAKESLLSAVRLLVEEHGVEAVAVVGRFPDDCVEELEQYRQGNGVDALAGVEAVISHLVVEHFGIPCAHAPALLPLPLLPTVSPRSAAEETGYTFLPCVLAGLSRAPQFTPRAPEKQPPSPAEHPFPHWYGPTPGPANALGAAPTIWAEQVDCVILPETAFGGAGALAFGQRQRKPLFIAVTENTTVLQDSPSKFRIPAIYAANYWEALGIVVAHKAGVDPHALRSQRIQRLTRARASTEYTTSQEEMAMAAVTCN